MLTFSSASARVIDSRRAIIECFEMLGNAPERDPDLLMIHASVGHNLRELVSEARRLAPRARILGSSCCGVIGREGVSESMRDVAIMAVKGPETVAAHVDGVFGHNCLEKAKQLAEEVLHKMPGVKMVYFLASGIDIANDLCIRAIEDALGPEVTIFGATSADNMRGIASFQIFDEEVFEHSAWLVGFGDPGLQVITAASHGFVAMGEPMLVTKSDGNLIIELDGKPAWNVYTERLGLEPDACCGDTIPIGALAERLDENIAAEYGNSHILRVVTSRNERGGMLYATRIEEGTPLWLTVRDEDRIFADMDRMTSRIVSEAGDARPVAVFHADCLARGRHMFNRILKEELVSRMQAPFACDGETPPWLGMYGFGEFARLGGKNQYHNYTSALYVIYRKLDKSEN